MDERPALAEALAAWALFGLVALAIVATYSRIRPEELWNVSVSGVEGGLGRGLVFLNYPVALAAIALAPVAAERIGTRGALALAAAAVLLCLVVGFPGVVEDDDLDAKPANALPALGVALALGLTLAAWRARGRGRAPRRVPLDRVRIALAAVLLLLSIPWIGAELGFYVELGGVFEADRIVPERRHPDLHAVHLGNHHGFNGVLLAVTALGLSRELGRVRRSALRTALTAYLALMLVYGLANFVNDIWLEQLVKRGAVDVRIPSVIHPAGSPAWLAMLAAAAAIYIVLRRTAAPSPSAP